MKNNEIKFSGCILKIKGKEITLTPEELFILKQEIEKISPTPPIFIKEYVQVPSQPFVPHFPSYIPPVTVNEPILYCVDNPSFGTQLSIKNGKVIIS